MNSLADISLIGPSGVFLGILGFSRETELIACVYVEREMCFKELAGKFKICRVGPWGVEFFLLSEVSPCPILVFG